MTPATTQHVLPAARSDIQLRELGLYSLPDGKEYVVSSFYSDGFSLYRTASWESFGNAEYWVSKDGKFLRYGLPTRWTIQDLKDTGRTTRYPKPNIK
jgi:hypothetical protein